jgi:hypothetical protein
MSLRKLIKNLSNLRDAFRVLEIMDHLGGVDIEQVEGYADEWRIKPKWYVTGRDAKDLQRITLFKEHHKKPSRLFHKLFYRNYRYGFRDFYYHDENLF